MAARFRKIDPRIWTDEKFRQLKAEEQRIALYILTAQSNRIGLFSFSAGKAREDLDMSPQTFRKGFQKVCQTLNWEWDADARVLYLPTWWRYNQPENGNNVIGNLKDLDDLPKTPLLERFSSNTTHLAEDLIQTFTQTLAKRYPQRSPKRSPSQEQEKEQKQEEERGAIAPTPPPDSQAPHAAASLATNNSRPRKRNSPAVLLTYEPEWFDRLRKNYPNGNGKKAAVEAWQKLHPSQEIWDQIRAAVKWQRESSKWLEENRKYVPMLSTYLNGERWTDKEILPPKPRVSI